MTGDRSGLRFFAAAAAASFAVGCPMPLPNGNGATDSGSASGSGDAGDAGDAGPAGADDGFVTISAPADGSTVSDQVALAIAFRDSSQVEGGIEIRVDGVVSDELGSPPTEPVTFDTTAFANGSHQLTVSCRDLNGDWHSHTIRLVMHNAPFTLDSYKVVRKNFGTYYQNGQTVEIDVAYLGNTAGLAVSASFANLDSGFNASKVSVTSLGSGQFAIKYPISAGNTVADGPKDVAVVATQASSQTSLTRTVTVDLRNVAPAPFDIEGATFVDDALPSDAVDPSTKVTVVSGDLQALVPGVASAIELAWTSDVEVSILYITVQGYAGYYMLPVTPGNTGTVTMQVTLPSVPAGAASAPVARRTAAFSRRSAQLQAGTCSSAAYEVVIMGTTICLYPATGDAGAGRVVLRWNGAADLDLYVTEPTGQVVSYKGGSKLSAAYMDMDANSECTKKDATPTESVIWPTGKMAAGTYKIQVALYNGCEGTNGAASATPLKTAVAFEKQMYK